MFSNRRIHKTFVYIFLITVTFIGTAILRHQRTYDINYNEIDSVKINDPITTSNLFRDKKVTKSISEMFAKLPELSDHVVFFNRVPKTGSEMLVLLMQWLQGLNGFKHIRLPGSNIRRLTRQQQVSYISNTTGLHCHKLFRQ